MGSTQSLLFTKAAFIWIQIQNKQTYCEILLQFEIAIIYLNIF